MNYDFLLEKVFAKCHFLSVTYGPFFFFELFLLLFFFLNNKIKKNLPSPLPL